MNKIRENWCNFILNEGIIPANLTRKLKDYSNTQNTFCVLLADLLKNQENADLNKYSLLPEKEIIKKSFKTDTELMNWLKSVKELLSVIQTYADKEAPFTEIVDEACRSFIKVCNLVSDDVKQRYLDTSDNKYLYSPKEGTDIKQEFKIYLNAQNYSPNTINSYTSAINQISTLPNIEYDLWEIADSDEMTRLINLLNANPDNLYDSFKEKDSLSRNIFSNSLKRYAEFLKAKKLNRPYKTEKKPEKKIGEYVQNEFCYILQSNKISEYEIQRLMDMNYCKQIFKTRGQQYPILATEERARDRYYKQPLKIRNKIYYISSQWYDDQLPYLKTWLKDHGIVI